MAGARLLRCVLAVLALGLLAAPAAHADAFDRIFHEYQQTGKVDPCKHSQKDLEKAQGQVPNDIEAYAPDFPNALQAAAEQRAGGACKSGKQGTAATPAAGTPAAPAGSTPAGGAPATPGATGTPTPTPDPQPAAAAADKAIANAADAKRTSNAGAPAAVVALGVLGALLLLAGLGYGLARWLAWDPAWADRGRHTMAEAGWRASATWSEFTDWLRLGR